MSLTSIVVNKIKNDSGEFLSSSIKNLALHYGMSEYKMSEVIKDVYPKRGGKRLLPYEVEKIDKYMTTGKLDKD